MALQDDLQAALKQTHSIQRELGGGGMSRLFVATEIALARTVVIKVLTSELASEASVERFRREVLLAARLQHPLIVPVLATGDCGGLPYFIMPLVEGESLRDRLARESELPAADVIRIARDVAQALSHAHENGVVHRDIKPENVLLSKGHALVTDFGVAKALASSAEHHGSTLTHAGVALGTPAYMSPEQASADVGTDHRADLYSLGVLLYEMLAGATPFAGRSAQGMLAAHATIAPEPLALRRPELPAGLPELVHRLLAKRPADRPQGAAEVIANLDDFSISGSRVTSASDTRAVNLRRRPLIAAATIGTLLVAVALGWRALISPRTAEAKVTAVLPFENVGGETANLAFALGMSDELITALGHLPGLQVTGRNSSFSPSLREATAREIGQKLGAHSFVAGTVRRSGGRVRVTAQLVNTGTGIAIWTETYERPLTDIFQVQDEIARAIANQLRITLGTEPMTASAASRGTADVEAYRLYLDGKQRWALRGTANLLASIDLFKRALQRDPQFARAKAGLAIAWVILPGNDTQFENVQDSIIQLGVVAAREALALAPNDPDARSALALAKAFAWDWEGAERDFLAVLRSDPSNVTTHIWYGLQLTAQNRTEEAIEILQRAVELDPLSQVAARNLAAVQMMGHRFDEAYATDRRMLQIDTTASRAIVAMLQAAMFAGKFDEAHRMADRLAQIGATGLSHLERSLVYARAGEESKAREAVALASRSPGVGSADLAFAYGLLGEADSVFAIFDAAASVRGHGFVDNMQICLPYFESLWNDPRFPALAKRMGVAMCTKTGAPRRVPRVG